jgi:hypothetical protein
METITIGTKIELAKHEAAIENLFLDSFGNPLSVDLWRWAYLNNPNGEPIVTLCFDDGALVGHYAMIPMPLSSEKSHLNTYLSMTTMVAVSHRKHYLFTTLAQTAYAFAKKSGVDFVMGFPNEQSAPGFKKRLDWNLPASDYVASLTKSEILAAAQSLQIVGYDSYRLNLSNATVRAWRLSKPGATYHWADGLAYKDYGDSVDLMAFDHPDQLAALPEDRLVNLLLPASAASLLQFKLFDYQFGGLSLSSPFDPDRIVRQMALSDVF